METLAEFEKAIETLTPFQKRVLAAIERAPNEMANSWEICWNDFAKEWNAKRSAHGAIFRSILQACQAMQEKDIVGILPPRDEHDTYTFSSHRKWVASREKQRAQQSVQADVAKALSEKTVVAKFKKGKLVSERVISPRR